MQFDARAAKLLKPGEHIIVEGCPGLRLVARASRRTWVYRYKSPVDQRMRQIAIGQWPALSIAVAAAEWEVLRARRDGGEDPAQDRRSARAAERQPDLTASKGYTVRKLLDDYLTHRIKPRRKPKGAAEVERLFERLVQPLMDRQAASVKRAEAFDLLESLASTPVQTSMLRRELGGAWDYGLDAGRLPEETPNWWRQIMRGQLKSKGKSIAGQPIGTKKRVLSEVEVGELIRWLPNFSKNVCDILTMYLWTGARGAEIVTMEHAEVSDEADGLWWTCPKHKTKNERHQEAIDLRVPLVGRAEDIVRRRMALYSGYLFPAARGATPHFSQKAVQTTVYVHQPYAENRGEVVPRLPVTHWAPHDLRRTARTLLAALGCPKEVGEMILGHMLPGIEGVYNLHTYDKERREWLTKLSERLERCAAAKPQTARAG